MTVLPAEQYQAVALRLADSGYVIDNGAISYHGTRMGRAKNVIKC
jgi:ABC-type branched-subunit amino acid transport system ATPase component